MGPCGKAACPICQQAHGTHRRVRSSPTVIYCPTPGMKIWADSAYWDVESREGYTSGCEGMAFSTEVPDQGPHTFRDESVSVIVPEGTPRMVDGLTADDLPPQLVMSELSYLANNGGVGTTFSLTRHADDHRPMKVVQNTLMEFSGGPDGVQLVEFSESFPVNYSTLYSRQDHFFAPEQHRQWRMAKEANNRQ
eukprot:COSAG01_NODE_2338_length_7873_cov_25.961538_10_plen_193_part_00